MTSTIKHINTYIPATPTPHPHPCIRTTNATEWLMKLYPHHILKRPISFFFFFFNIHTDMQYLNKWDNCAGPIPYSASKRKRVLGFDTVYLHDLWHWWDLVNPWKASMGMVRSCEPLKGLERYSPQYFFACFLNPWKASMGRAHYSPPFFFFKPLKGLYGYSSSYFFLFLEPLKGLSYFFHFFFLNSFHQNILIVH